jgi:hypothetical protein
MMDNIHSCFGLPKNQFNVAKFSPKIEQRLLKTDTFQKTSPPLTFKGCHFSKSADAVEKRNDRPSKLSTVRSFDPEKPFKKEILLIAKREHGFPWTLNEIGQGREYTVFKLSDQYVYRLPVQDRYSTIENFDVSSFDIVPHFPTRIKSRPLARLGGWTRNGEYISGYIHSKVNGKQGSVDYASLSSGRAIPPFKYQELTTQYKDYIRDMAELPQHSYKNLIQDIKALNNAGFCFEPNPNKLMVDKNAQQLNLVGIEDISQAVNKKKFPEGEANNLGYLLSMLIDMRYLNMEKDIRIFSSESGTYGDGLPRLRRMVMKKALQAACTENFIQLPGLNYQTGNGHSRTFSVESMFETANMNHNHWRQVQKILEKAQALDSVYARQKASMAIGAIFDNVGD